MQISDAISPYCVDQNNEFKYKSKLHQLWPNALDLLELCVSKYQIGIWSSKSGSDKGDLFRKFLGSKKKVIVNKIKYIWFVDKCNAYSEGKYAKNLKNIMGWVWR